MEDNQYLKEASTWILLNDNDDEDSILPYYYRTTYTWAFGFAVYVSMVGSVILIIINLLVTLKVLIFGTRSPFIVSLLLIYMISNVCAFLEAFYNLKYVRTFENESKA